VPPPQEAEQEPKADQPPSRQFFVPATQEILLLQVELVQVLAAQPLSTTQFLVPGIQVRLFQQVSVVQVLTAQALLAQV